MTSQAILAGISLAGVGLAGRIISQAMPALSKIKMPTMPTMYVKGGFDDEMSQREAGRILGVSPSGDAKRIQAAHRRLMLSGIHPDKGGSAYLTTKINEAKDLLMKRKGK